VEGETEPARVADEDDVSEVGQWYRSAHGQRAHVRIEGGRRLACGVGPGSGQADDEADRQGDGTHKSEA
jgi:hypothetical protein